MSPVLLSTFSAKFETEITLHISKNKIICERREKSVVQMICFF